MFVNISIIDFHALGKSNKPALRKTFLHTKKYNSLNTIYLNKHCVFTDFLIVRLNITHFRQDGNANGAFVTTNSWERSAGCAQGLKEST